MTLVSIFTTREFMKELYIKGARDFSLTIRREVLKMMESGEKNKFQILKSTLLKEGKFLKEIKFYRENRTEIGGKGRFEEPNCPRDEICIARKKAKIEFFYAIHNEDGCKKCHTGEKILSFVEMQIDTSNLHSVLKKISYLLVGLGTVFLILLISGTQAIFSLVIEKPIRNMMDGIKKYENGMEAQKVKLEMKSREFSMLSDELLNLFIKLENARKELDEFYHQKMQRADKLATLGELASSVAHEIKNPLAGINGVIQVLLKEEEVPYKAKEILKEILNLTARLNRTVQNLLRFAKDTPMSFKLANINELIKKTLLLIEGQAITNKVFIQIHLDPSIPPAIMDEEQIQHLLMNLILNAIQAMPDGGKISIKTSVEEKDGNKHIKVSISDTGTGIPKEIMGKIFDPFFTTRPHGTGLGLYICKKIIKSHNGEIWVESEEKKGSTFYFTIPLKDV